MVDTEIDVLGVLYGIIRVRLSLHKIETLPYNKIVAPGQAVAK